MVWIHPSTSVEYGSLAYCLNKQGVKTMVIEEGVALKIDYDNCDAIIDGLFALMKEIGIWKGEVKEIKKPLVLDDTKVEFINAETSGIFIPSVKYASKVAQGDEIGKIVDVITGFVEETITAPIDGYLYTMREYPAVEEGSLIARVFSDK